MSAEHDRVDVRGTVSFVGLTYLVAWPLTIPMFLTGTGLTSGWAPVIILGMMSAPALAGIVVHKWISPRGSIARELGITGAGGFRRWWGYALIAWFGPAALALFALVVGWMLGVYRADWFGFSGLAETYGPAEEISPEQLALDQLLQVFLLGWLNVIPAFGAELGWRGYLTRALLPLGQPAAFLITGVLWALWHGPLLVLGYNYPNAPIVVAFIMMGCYGVLTSTLLGWLRLASRSVWPAAIAHGFLNSAAGLGLLFSAAGSPVDSVTTGLLGWSGWIVLALAILVLALLRKLPVEFPQENPGISRGVRRLSRR